MHLSSYEHMARLVATHLDADKPLDILDIGACAVEDNFNGCYRPLFDAPHWRYRGVDLAPGANVDIVLESPYALPMQSASVDVIVSGQAFEHMEYFWMVWREMARVLRPGGLAFLIAPSRGPEHRYPVDCWRFYPDGYRALARYGGFELLEVQTDWQPHADPGSAPWGDTVGVFRRQRNRALRRWAMRLVSLIERRLAKGAPGESAA